MCSDFLNFEYDGLISNDYIWKDNPYYFHSLSLKAELNYHDSCVNTVCWDDSGECLLSGSDDRCIVISRAFSQDVNNSNVYTQRLPSSSNIFIAKFTSQNCGSEVVVGFKCGCVLYVYPNLPPTENVKLVFCHKLAVYDILTLSESPSCFITLSHDQTVKCFDARLPPTSKIEQNCSRDCFASQHFSTVRNFSAVNSMKFKFPVTAGDVHPLDGSRCIALATADGFVRLFDLRKLVSSNVSSMAVGESSQPLPFRLARPIGLPAKVYSNQNFPLGYGPGHITSVKFEPIYQLDHARLFSPTHRPRSFSSSNNFGGKRLLVSHMHAPVFLYDLNSDETVQNFEVQRPDWLPISENDEQTHSSTSESESIPISLRDSLMSDPNIRLSVALYRWLIRFRSQGYANSENETTNDSHASSSDDLFNTNSSEQTSDEQPCRSGSRAQPRWPIDYLTDDYLAEVLASAPRCRQLMMYRGRRCYRTVIKASTFWGRDYILSGSECGHLVAWARESGKPVNAIKADSAVVNRIAPHPYLPSCSGFDRSIKLIEPDPNIYYESNDNESHNTTLGTHMSFQSMVKRHAEEANQICENNEAFSKRISNMCNAQFERLRAGEVARMILLRIARASNNNNNTISSNFRDNVN